MCVQEGSAAHAGMGEYAAGFHRRTPAQCRRAILGHDTGATHPPSGTLPVALHPWHTHFRGLPAPQAPEDWLCVCAEEGQSFTQFLEQTPWLSRRRITRMKQRFVPGVLRARTRTHTHSLSFGSHCLCCASRVPVPLSSLLLLHTHSHTRTHIHTLSPPPPLSVSLLC